MALPVLRPDQADAQEQHPKAFNQPLPLVHGSMPQGYQGDLLGFGPCTQPYEDYSPIHGGSG